ncbi:MAG: PspC domain-containing protein [Syntrophales bacterium]|jgi:phage shock protein PspC (stress-responsive transcriptional regulator)|nr:PspC domain-containing protein [Syntrophales bacterium]MDD4339803.1 PspC domain-containing protein [Syntrophales bacterium]HPB70222.1 PspC domain-containing protein [Syntrophales bacterium]HQN25727.1 PspC domain-containing protein [Syntrophales bacterium]HQP28358.1 PspC domain-containing protein [Syntrophales bacterium]
MKRLYLATDDRKIGGVCGGIAEYVDRDPTLIRVLFLLLVIFSFGFGILAYLGMWLVIPKKPASTGGGARGDG